MMNKILLVALLGVVAADRLSAPSNGYSAPNGRPNGANGSGQPNGYSAPSTRLNGGNGNAISNGYSTPNGNGPSSAYGAPGADKLAELADSLPGGGVPGEDFPVLSEVPDTGFQCGDQTVSGYYADVNDEVRCQVFHICQLRESGKVQQDSFLCPNGTIFNQQYLVCDWWFNFDCSTAEDFYSVNELIGQASSANGAYGAPTTNGASGNGVNGAYGTPAAIGANGAPATNGVNGNGANGNGAPTNNGAQASAANGAYGAPAANSNGVNGNGNDKVNGSNGNGYPSSTNGRGSNGNGGNGSNGYSRNGNGNVKTNGSGNGKTNGQAGSFTGYQ